MASIKMTDKGFVALAMGEVDAFPALLMSKIGVHDGFNLATRLPVLFTAQPSSNHAYQ